MAKLLSTVVTIQNEIVRLKDDRTSVQGEALRSLDTRLSAYLALQASGGRAPTKRDALGNVLLYEDPLLPGSQLQRADQYVTVEVIKPDYDDGQAKEVLDTQINELYTPADTSELARLRGQVETLRQELRDAEAPITVIQGDDGTDRTDGGTRFPPIAITLPDAIAGIVSNTQPQLDTNTAIFNDETMILGNFSSANPFSVNWWIIDHETEEIYGQGVDDTLSSVGLGEVSVSLFIEGKLDVVMELTRTPINFNGWYVNDQSLGQLTNYFKVSNERMIRFRFIPRKQVGNSLIDQVRNTYYMIASFLNETPKYHNKEPVVVVISSANILNELVSTLGYFDPVILNIKEIDENGVIWNEQTITTVDRTRLTAHIGNKLVMSAPTKIRTFGNDNLLAGWYIKNVVNNTYTKLTANRSYEAQLLIDTNYRFVVGYYPFAVTSDLPNPPIDIHPPIIDEPDTGGPPPKGDDRDID